MTSDRGDAAPPRRCSASGEAGTGLSPGPDPEPDAKACFVVGGEADVTRGDKGSGGGGES